MTLRLFVGKRHFVSFTNTRLIDENLFAIEYTIA